MKPISVFCQPLLLAAICAWPASADVIVENFNYAEQFDLLGFVDGGDTVYRITTTGTYGTATDFTVATFSEGFQSGAGIANEGGNFVARFTTGEQLGVGAGQHFVGIADIPGFGDTPPGGPFGAFFATPQNLTDASGSLDVKQFSGGNATFFRFLAVDAFDNEVATNLHSISGAFQTFNFVAADFINQVQGSGFDETQVTSVGIEYFATADGSNNLDALEFRADNFVLITIPEPNAICATLLMGGLFVIRRRRPVVAA